MNTTTIFHTLALTLLIAAPLGAQKANNKPLPTPPPPAQKSAQLSDIYPMPPASYYLKHFGVGFIAVYCQEKAFGAATKAAGCTDSQGYCNSEPAKWINLCAMLGNLYLVPQWTDRYIIGNNTTCTTQENIIRMLPIFQLGNYYVQLQRHRASVAAAQQPVTKK